MSGTVAILRELHRHQKHASDLSAEIDRGPKTLQAHQVKVTKQEEKLREAQEGLKRLKLNNHEKEVTLKAKLQQIEKYQRQLNEASSKKEYDALKVEIASTQQECRKLEDEILDGMGELEAQAGRLPEVEREVQKFKQDYAKTVSDVQARRHELTERLSAVHKQIEETRASLPEDVRVQYDRLAAARGPDALSAVEGRTCQSCYTEITAQSYIDLLRGQLVICRSCDRILYLTEQAADKV